MEELYIKNPFFDEGKLSVICQTINNNQTFAVLAVKLGLNRALFYDYKVNDMWAELQRFANFQHQNGHHLPHQLVIKISDKIILIS